MCAVTRVLRLVARGLPEAVPVTLSRPRTRLAAQTSSRWWAAHRSLWMRDGYSGEGGAGPPMLLRVQAGEQGATRVAANFASQIRG